MEIERYWEESFKEGMGFGGGFVKAVSEKVLESALKKEDDDEAFMETLYNIARVRVRDFVGTLLERR